MIRRIDSRISRGLLHDEYIPPLVADRFAQGGRLGDRRPAVALRLIIGIFRCVGGIELAMLPQRTARVIEPSQHDVADAGRFEQLGQVHHAVVGKTVAHAQDTERIGPDGQRKVGCFGLRAQRQHRQQSECAKRETKQFFHAVV